MSPRSVSLRWPSPPCYLGCTFGNAVAKWKLDYLKKALASEEASVHVGEEDQLDFLTRNFRYR
jgi:hypothetical protein